MRFESLYWLGMILFAVLGIVRWESQERAGQAVWTSQSVIVERYAARALELRNLSGRLEIETGFGAGVEVMLQGRPEALAALRRQLEGDTLVIAAGTTAERGATAAVTARVRLPSGLPVTILGHRGHIVSGDLQGPLSLTLASGVAALGRIRDAQLRLTGNGQIAAREALGNLSIAVTGAGEVRIAQSLLERLEVGVAGKGAVDVGGAARFASLSLVGSGRIYLAEAERQPLIERIGSGEILIDAR